MLNEKIFVQIASYRDPELIHTIRDCLTKAKYPDRLKFGICWQHATVDEWDNLTEYLYNPAFKIISVNHTESKGACWARHMAQKMWNDEKYSLQIDSHTRFVQDWDELLINLWESMDDPMAIFTGYPPNYSPNLPYEEWDHAPKICNVYAVDNGKASARPSDVPNWKERTTPYKSIHVSAGFIFGLGEINTIVPYDPLLYFLGEETNLTVRYFTHGYNLYHPHKLLMYHYYTRPDNKKHWDDDPDWGEYSNTASKRLDCLLGKNTMWELNEYGLGTKRTLQEFIEYSGVDLINSVLHDDVKSGIEPPCSNSNAGWDPQVDKFDNVITWDYEQVEKCNDPRFWGVFVCDQNKKALFRADIENWKNPEIISGEVCEWPVTFEYKRKYQTPTYILIWPYSESRHWLNNVYLPLLTK